MLLVLVLLSGCIVIWGGTNIKVSDSHTDVVKANAEMDRAKQKPEAEKNDGSNSPRLETLKEKRHKNSSEGG